MKTVKELQTVLAGRINETEAELEALKAVQINTSHKTLTSRAVTGGRIGDYLGIDKALYVSYQAGHRYMSFDMIAYSYAHPDGSEIGVNGGLRISRTVSPAELRDNLDKVIAGREASLLQLKTDLVNADKIIAKYNRLAEQMSQLLDSTSYATRGVLK